MILISLDLIISPKEIIHESHSLYVVLTWITLFSQKFYPEE